MWELRKIRKQKSITQRELSRASGVDTATISLVETGKRQPKLETLESLARALGVEVGEFFPPGQPDLFAAAKQSAGYAYPEPPSLELAAMYEASRQDRERTLRAAGTAEVARYLADVERALEIASHAPDENDTPDTRRQLVAYVSRLGALRDQALPHAGVAEAKNALPPVALGAQREAM